MHQLKTPAGFSLLELSIVLVIIGLITGGIMAGRSMVRAAELRSVMSDLNKYQSAVQTFRERYGALPGDMRNATSYWGAAHATAATCEITASTGTETCNGNGDGYIYVKSDTNTEAEEYRAWQHLANAGMIEGKYNGISDPSTPTGHVSVVGVNVPGSKITGAGYSVVRATSGGMFYTNSLSHIIQFGMQVYPALNTTTRGGVFTPAEAYALDLKMDDGKPAYGSLMNATQGSTITPNCTTTAVATTAEYDLSRSSLECPMIFGMNF